jgi:ribosomal protein S26
MLHCPKCQSSETVDFDTLNSRFVRYRQTGSIRELQCPQCGFFIPGRNALNAATMAEAVDRQRRFEELLKQ